MFNTTTTLKIQIRMGPSQRKALEGRKAVERNQLVILRADVKPLPNHARP